MFFWISSENKGRLDRYWIPHYSKVGVQEVPEDIWEGDVTDLIEEAKIMLKLGITRCAHDTTLHLDRTVEEVMAELIEQLESFKAVGVAQMKAVMQLESETKHLHAQFLQYKIEHPQ